MVKAILIDDEYIVVGGIKSIVHWERLGIEIVGTAADGVEGLKLIREVQPDIVLTDIRMPRMNGLTLIETVRMFAPEIVFIIFSSYQEFHYVQTAISLGVIDYLDKPITVQKLEQSLLKARNIVERRRYNLHSDQYAQARSDVCTDAVRELIRSGQIENTQLLEKINLYESGGEREEMVAAAVKCCGGRPMDDYACGIVQKHVGSLFSKYGMEPVTVRNETTLTVLVAGMRSDGGPFSGLLKDLVRLCDQDGVDIVVGCGKTYAGISGALKSGAEAEKAVHYAEFMESAEPVSIEQIEFSYSIPAFFSKSKESITMDIRCGNKDKVVAAVAKFTAELRNYSLPQDFFCHECLDLVYLALQVSAETGSNFIQEYRPDFYPNQVIYGFATIEKLSQWLCEFFSVFMDWMAKQRKNTNHHSVVRAKKYIEENYSKDISLTELSEMTNMNPTYLSVLFKDTVGMTYIKYLTKIRLDRARDLLAQGHKVTDVSRMVGYHDYRHFCELFKKHTGMTPKMCRGDRMP